MLKIKNKHLKKNYLCNHWRKKTSKFCKQRLHHISYENVSQYCSPKCFSFFHSFTVRTSVSKNDSAFSSTVCMKYILLAFPKPH